MESLKGQVFHAQLLGAVDVMPCGFAGSSILRKEDHMNYSCNVAFVERNWEGFQ